MNKRKELSVRAVAVGNITKLNKGVVMRYLFIILIVIGLSVSSTTFAQTTNKYVKCYDENGNFYMVFPCASTFQDKPEEVQQIALTPGLKTLLFYTALTRRRPCNSDNRRCRRYHRNRRYRPYTRHRGMIR